MAEQEFRANEAVVNFLYARGGRVPGGGGGGGCTYFNNMEDLAVQAAYQEMVRQGQLAQERAEQLLTHCLTPAQRDEKTMHGWFTVIGSLGNTWRVNTTATSGNLELVNTKYPSKYPQGAYCAGPGYGDGLPYPDIWLAQKMALEADEEGLLNVAVYQTFRRTLGGGGMPAPRPPFPFFREPPPPTFFARGLPPV